MMDLKETKNKIEQIYDLVSESYDLDKSDWDVLDELFAYIKGLEGQIVVMRSDCENHEDCISTSCWGCTDHPSLSHVKQETERLDWLDKQRRIANVSLFNYHRAITWSVYASAEEIESDEESCKEMWEQYTEEYGSKEDYAKECKMIRHTVREAIDNAMENNNA